MTTTVELLPIVPPLARGILSVMSSGSHFESFLPYFEGDLSEEGSLKPPLSEALHRILTDAASIYIVSSSIEKLEFCQ